MHRVTGTREAIAGLSVGVTTSAAASGVAKLQVLHREALETMPCSSKQEVRVLHASLDPGDRTPRHTHRYPVTVHVLEGTFTLDLDGRKPVILAAGATFVEPANVAMTGRNGGTEPTTMVLFYVSEPGVPFADPVEDVAS